MIGFFPHPSVQITKGSIGHYQWPACDLFLIWWCLHCVWSAAFHHCLPAALFTVAAIVLLALYNICFIRTQRSENSCWCAPVLKQCIYFSRCKSEFYCESWTDIWSCWCVPASVWSLSANLLLITHMSEFIFIIETDTICVIARAIWGVVMEFMSQPALFLFPGLHCQTFCCNTSLWSLHSDLSPRLFWVTDCIMLICSHCKLKCRLKKINRLPI